MLEEITRGNLSASVALSLVDLAGNADLAAKAAADLMTQNATQERAPKIIEETLAKRCPVVSEGYVYGERERTCDPSAHKDCACRRHIKPMYSADAVVCIDPNWYAEVEGAARAKLEEKQRKAVERAEAKAEESDGVLDLKALKWIGYGTDAHYHDVTSPYGGRQHDCIGDHSQCACLRQGKGPHENERTRLICIDVKQFNRVERAAKKEHTKAAIAQLTTENEQLSAWALGNVERLYSEGIAMILQPADLAYLATWVFLNCDVGSGPNYVPRADRQKYLDGLGMKVDVGGYLPNKRLDVAKAFLEQGSPETLLRIIFEWPLIAQGKSQGLLPGWYRAQADPEAAAADATEPQSADDEPEDDNDRADVGPEEQPHGSLVGA